MPARAERQNNQGRQNEQERQNDEEHQNEEQHQIQEGGRNKKVPVTKVEMVSRYICHAAGASFFYLHYAMTQAGVPLFAAIACFETFVVGYSLLQTCNLPGQPRRHFYMSMVENPTTPLGKKNIFCVIFVIDVVVCGAIYHTTASALLQFLWESYSGKGSPDLAVLWIILSALCCLGLEIRDKYNDSKNRFSNTNAATTDALGDRAFNDEPQSLENVGLEMRDYTLKRLIVLIMFMCIISTTILYPIRRSQKGKFQTRDEIQDSFCRNISENCKEIGNYFAAVWEIDTTKAVVAASVLLFALMNYSLIIPVLDIEEGENPEVSKKNFSRIVKLSNLILLITYIVTPLLVHVAFQETAVVSVCLYGPTVYGAVVGVCGVVLTITACRIRVMACCKLIPVVWLGMNDGSSYYVTAIIVTFLSIIFAGTISSLQLVVFAGAVTANLLLVFIPLTSQLCTPPLENFTWEKTRALALMCGQAYVMIMALINLPTLVEEDV